MDGMELLVVICISLFVSIISDLVIIICVVMALNSVTNLSAADFEAVTTILEHDLTNGSTID